eukprot:Protomagalhaensia_sp_Gyna_25__2821@NODE_2634_length_973_cov_1315_692719_g2195_i0_p1_GENE_NODE_2634_length_973_cov_1315_692719_g2195_i0NODE_2634_length_973_cov_1315_692719_g2195_i0_p1_ORF_typecomplete_len261_score55_62Ribosomal_S3Ae/PF01015_18/9_9e94Transcrip_act/PF04949_13/1_6e03Transcrip_act/PF04949_13/0_53_NODE_2634_length_973_cov_1315_692719_g2195_i0138920
MAIGKNKRVTKSGRKGGKKKVIDPFTKKEWYLVKAPNLFTVHSIGNTLVTRSQAGKLASDSLKGRVYEVNLADLQDDEEQFNRKVKLYCEDVQGKSCLTDFHGLELTRDYLCSLVRKWHTLIDATCDVKTLDGYHLRITCIAFTKKAANQRKATCYAQSSQVHAIRARMVKIIQEEANKCLLKDLVRKFIPKAVENQIEKSCRRVFPLEHVCLRKVKVIKKPKTDMQRLMELHEGTGAGTNQAAEADEAQNLLTAEVEAA